MPLFVIIWGSYMAGKVDQVEGLFYVKTRFGHLWYIPLIPMSSYLVFSESGDGIRGVPLPLNGKSVFLGWLRAACIVGAIISFIVGLATLDDRAPGSRTVVVMAFAVGISLTLLLLMTTFLRFFTHAGYERARKLAYAGGLGEELLLLIDQHFQQQSQLAASKNDEFDFKPNSQFDDFRNKFDSF